MPNDDSATSNPDTEVRPPDGVSEKALRWGRYVVERLSISDGDVIVVRGPNNKAAQKKRNAMIAALKAHLSAENVFYIEGPTKYTDISMLSEDDMRALGWVRASESTQAECTDVERTNAEPSDS